MLKTSFGIIAQNLVIFNRILANANIISANAKIVFTQRMPIYPDKEAETGRRQAVKKSEREHWITNIENTAAVICSELDSAVVEAVFRRYGAISAEDANPDDLPEIFSDLYAIEADLN